MMGGGMLQDTRQKFGDRVGAMWCGLMHNGVMWPIHGQYQCAECGRHYPVEWTGDQTSPIRREPSASLRSAVTPLIIGLALLLPFNIRAANATADASNQQAAMAFARYIADQEQTSAWSVETVEVDASLPGRKTQGHLRAIRRLLLGKPQYQVLDMAGDKTVRQQVILRYLSGEVQAADIPAASVAITPANYRFHYNGPVVIGGATAYSFSIKPRKHREGLIRGEVAIDGESGAVVRESGYLVKSPSIFVKRITVNRVSDLCRGLVQERITHISVETRLIGRAELTVSERPWMEADEPAASGPGPQER